MELRRPAGASSEPYGECLAGQTLSLPDGGSIRLLEPYHQADSVVGCAGSVRLWEAEMRVPGELFDYLARHGRPIRYGHGIRQPISAYQTAYTTEPGSAEMPSAGRGFTPELITRLVARGVMVAPLLLHTGVSSLESGEPPYPEWYRVPESTARLVNAARAWGGRVIAVGTTVVRALESAAREDDRVEPVEAWTDLMITPEHGIRVIDGLITGWHRPEASHLLLLEAVDGRELLEAAYREALARRYLWHEFGDLHLILP